MTHTLEQINAKVSRMKCNLAGEPIKPDKILDRMQKFDAFIGNLDNYTDQERTEIKEIQRAFYKWCKDRE